MGEWYDRGLEPPPAQVEMVMLGILGLDSKQLILFHGGGVLAPGTPPRWEIP